MNCHPSPPLSIWIYIVYKDADIDPLRTRAMIAYSTLL